MMLQTSLLLFFRRIQASGQRKKQTCWPVHSDRWGTMSWLKSAAMYSAESQRTMLCRLYSWTESRFMVRNHSAAAVLGLSLSDVNFNISCFVHNNGFCFLQVWCPTVSASSGHRVPLNFGLHDTLSTRCSKNVQHWLYMCIETNCNDLSSNTISGQCTNNRTHALWLLKKSDACYFLCYYKI